MTKSYRAGMVVGLMFSVGMGTGLFALYKILEAVPGTAPPDPGGKVVLEEEHEPTLLDCIATIDPQQPAVALRAAIHACKVRTKTGG